MFRIGLIGCGAISRGQVAAIDTIDDAQIVAACDLSEANLKEVTDKTGAKGYADYKEMVKTEKLDLVIISLPHGLHREATCLCAELGIDVFLEKPMGISSEDCQIMIDACEKAGVMLWVGHIQRYMQPNMFAKQLIDSGEFGELISMHETRNGEYFHERRPKWFGKKAMSGGGIAINLGAHCLDKFKYFSGSNIAEIKGGIHIHEGLDCEDAVQAFVTMENGVTGTMNLIGMKTPHRYEVVLYLTNGEIRIVYENGEFVHYCKNGEPMQCKEIDYIAGMTLQLQDVIAALRSGEKKPKVDGYYGKDVIHAVKRIYGDEK